MITYVPTELPPGTITPQQVYAAPIVLDRLRDRRVGRTMTLDAMCEVLGYLGNGRRPSTVPNDRPAPSGLRSGPRATH